MQATTIINGAFVLFAVLGAADYLLDNRFGLGAEFERGICCAGKLIIAMTGFMSRAPILGRVLTPVVTPIFTAVGADPSALAGMLLANDSGGAALAAEMALDPAAGEFNGYFTGAMLGGSVMCLIPMTMLCTRGTKRTASVYGLVIGLFSVPFGCLVGGLIAGYSLRMLLCNLIPVAILSFALFLALVLFQRWVLRPFQLFGKLLVAINLMGLLLTTAKELLGAEFLPGLEPFTHILPVIGNIALVLSGVFPLLAVVSRALQRPLSRGAERLQVEKDDMSGLLVASVNVFPTLDMLNRMTEKGALLNAAFMVGGNCLLGDHFAFTSQSCPRLVIPVMIAKAISGFLALGVAILLAPKLLNFSDAPMPPRTVLPNKGENLS